MNERIYENESNYLIVDTITGRVISSYPVLEMSEEALEFAYANRDFFKNEYIIKENKI